MPPFRTAFSSSGTQTTVSGTVQPAAIIWRLTASACDFEPIATPFSTSPRRDPALLPSTFSASDRVDIRETSRRHLLGREVFLRVHRRRIPRVQRPHQLTSPRPSTSTNSSGNPTITELVGALVTTRAATDAHTPHDHSTASRPPPGWAPCCSCVPEVASTKRQRRKAVLPLVLVSLDDLSIIAGCQPLRRSAAMTASQSCA